MARGLPETWTAGPARASISWGGGYNFRRAHYVDCLITRKTRLNKRPFDHDFLAFGV